LLFRTLGFFGLLFGILTFVAFYVTRRSRELFGLDARGDRTMRMVMMVLIAAPLVRFVVGSGVVVEAVAIVGFAVGLGAAIATGFLVPIDLVSGIAGWVARRRAKRAVPMVAREGKREVESESEGKREIENAAPPVATRRSFLRRASIGGALAIGGGTSLYGVTLGRHDYVLEQVPIRLARLPRTLDGYTIAQLSDVHVGTFVGEWELSVARDLLGRARPDLIVLTGDLVDHDPAYLPQLGRAMRRIVDLAPRDGVVAILGNHDYYAGAEETLEILRRAGVRVLRNEAMTLGDAGGRFALLGVDDVWAERNGYDGRVDLPATLAAAEPDLARVLLCHNPELFPEAAEHVDLQLSGHTHGGQVNFMVHPIDLVLRHGYIAGHYTRGDSQIYVNRGFGTAGPPARVQTPPEVSRIILASA
jgi:predicted MPP superfamily phosphohydrolase